MKQIKDSKRLKASMKQQCRSSRNGRSARSLSFEERQQIAEREAARNRYDSVEYVCDVDGKSVFCTIFDKNEACIVGLPEFIEVYYDGTVRSFQGFDYMDLIEDDLEAEDLIKQCHYFKDEDVNPYDGKPVTDGTDQNKSMIWFYERFWVKQRASGQVLTECLNEYLAADLRFFEAEDNVPVSLKALLFNRYMKGSSDGNTEPFKAFYRQYYSMKPQQQTKAELIAKCRIFDDEDSLPDSLSEDQQFIWKYERFWVQESIQTSRETETARQSRLSDYYHAGLKDFQSEDGTPIDLKAILFNRFCKYLELTDPERFMKWYVEVYQRTSKQQT